MRIALAVHAWPEPGAGGVERSLRCLAQDLARAGHAVRVIAGSSRRAPDGRVALERSLESLPDSAHTFELVRVLRPDLYFDHWHKSRSPGVAQAVGELLREHASDVLHVHHWLRLSRDLVASAARVGVPALVSLHDTWCSCPLVFRVRSADRATCGSPCGPDPCVACAGRVPPRTPWVDQARGWMALAERQRDLLRELELARAVIVPSAYLGVELERTLGLSPGTLDCRVLPPARRPLARPSEAQVAEPGLPGSLQLVSWGSLSEPKGSDLLLAALEHLGAGRGPALDLFGDGPVEWVHDLRNAAVGLDVRFHGACEPEQLAQRGAARAQAFVSGTRAVESYGLVLDEAFELGLPAVLPDQGAFLERCGPVDTTGRGVGALFYARGDARSLAAALARLRDEPGLLAGLRAEARARGEASRAADPAARSVAAHLQLYEQTVSIGAPELAAPEWFESRLAAAELQAWDDALARCTPQELGWDG